MKQNGSVTLKKRGTSLLVLLLVLLALCGSILDYAVQNERLVKKNVYETMDAAARQQLMLFDTKLQDQFAQLGVLADYAATKGAALDEEFQYAMSRTAEKYGLFGIGLIDASDGIAHLNTGETFDAAGRAYYQRALKGERAVEYAEHGRLTGVSIVVLAVPVYTNGRIAAVLFATYDTAGFAALLETAAFDGRSYSYMTDSDGCILVGPAHKEALISRGNVLDYFAKAKLERGVTTADVAAHMRNGDAFTFSVSSGSETRYVTFRPVGVNDWSLFYVATEEVVAEQAGASARMVYALAMKLFGIFAVFVIIVWRYERSRQRDISLREEEFRIAASQSDKIIMRYDIQKKTSSYAQGHMPKGSVRRTLADGVPESVVAAGLVAEESVADYLDFYAAMRRGEHTGSKVCRMKTNSDDFAWFRADYTLVGGARPPRFAIVTFDDVTKQREQESIYEKWRQSLRGRKPESYTLFHCSIGSESSIDTREGTLLAVGFEPGPFAFDSHTAQYVAQYVAQADRERLSTFLKTGTLLENCHQGKRVSSLEYREKLADGGIRWIRLTVDLVELADAAEIEAYLLFEDIDEAKRAELALLERAETDALTGLLNRQTFVQRADRRIQEAKPGAVHALLMLDIDGFKLVNDALGHGAGDQALTEIAAALSRCSRRSDLVGRLGGDEFVVFLPDIPNEAVAARKAQQIGSSARRTLRADVRISVSVGIACYPQDGESFAALYQKADAALYYVKGAGKDSYAFYRAGMATPADAGEKA